MGKKTNKKGINMPSGVYIRKQKTGKIRVCPICKKKRYVMPSLISKRNFCSRKCYVKDWAKRMPGWNKGKKISNKLRKKYSLAHKGCIPWNKGKKRPEITGKNHWNWKGGKTSKSFKIRNSLEYKLWRKAVFERDNYTCIWCGNNKSGNLNADHIKPFALFPELRFAIDNGRTLCKDCHKKTKTYFIRWTKY